MYGEGQMPPTCEGGGRESEMHLLLKCPETQRLGEEFLNRNWHGIKEEVATRKILTEKNATELRDLGIIA